MLNNGWAQKSVHTIPGNSQSSLGWTWPSFSTSLPIPSWIVVRDKGENVYGKVLKNLMCFPNLRKYHHYYLWLFLCHNKPKILSCIVLSSLWVGLWRGEEAGAGEGNDVWDYLLADRLCPQCPGLPINRKGERGLPPTAFEASQGILNPWKALSR
jgi:hypothetical protein